MDLANLLIGQRERPPIDQVFDDSDLVQEVLVGQELLWDNLLQVSIKELLLEVRHCPSLHRLDVQDGADHFEQIRLDMLLPFSREDLCLNHNIGMSIFDLILQVGIPQVPLLSIWLF